MCKKLKFDQTNKWYMHNPAAVVENDTHKLLWDFWHTHGSLNLGQKIRPYCNQQKKRTCKIVDFVVLAYHRIKLKECEKKDKILDLARQFKKKLWNMKVTIIIILSGVFDTVTKGILKKLEDLEVWGRVETPQIIVFLRTARILRIVLETWGYLLSLKLQRKAIS